MAYSYKTYTASGSTANFTITFPYLSRTHVNVYANGGLLEFGVDYNYMSATVIHFLTGNPTAGTVIRLERDTPVETQFVNYTDGSTLVETDLDNAELQALYLVQELQDQISDINAGVLPVVAGTSNRISVVAAGVPTTYTVDISATYVGQATITTLGTIATGTWSATAIAVNKGGTGLTSYAVGDLLYASASATLAKLADVATGNALISGGVATAPSWGKIALTTHVSGTLAVGNGGTGIAAITVNRIPYASATDTIGTSANLTFNGTLLAVAGNISGTQVAVGTTISTSAQFQIGGSFTGSGQTEGMRFASTLTGVAGANSFGLIFVPNLTEAASGAHGQQTGIYVAPTFTNNAGATTTAVYGINIDTIACGATAPTTAAALRITVPTGGGTNYSILVSSGLAQFNGILEAKGGLLVSGGSFAAGTFYADGAGGIQIGLATGSVYDFVMYKPNGGSAIMRVPTGTTGVQFIGTVQIQTLGAFASGDKYVIVDASGNLHVSSLGPIS